MDRVTDRYIKNDDQLIGMLAKRNIKAKSYITKSSIAKPVLIKKGAKTDVYFIKGSIMLQGIAVALENAGKDDLIKLRNPDSNKTFVATVADKNKAVIQR